MRGKVAIIEKSDKVFRITPAYAGKSMGDVNMDSIFEDHPRLCGEKHFPIKLMCPPPGSPPPMRGKVLNIRPDTPI